MHVNIDPNFVDNMVNEVKSQGVFDAFRRDSMADVDTKPAYQNLKQRVENTVTKFLSEQKWCPELNKNQVREKLRKHVIDAGFLDVGVQRIVDQVVNPKISTVFEPRIEDIVYKYLGIDKPELKVEPKIEQYNLNDNLTINTDLLPTDLEAVSPDSDKSTAKSDTQLERKYEIHIEHEDEDDESPPFEPLEGPSPSKIKEDDISNYSHLSGISGLTSQSGMQEDIKNQKEEEKIGKKEMRKNDNVQNSIGEFAQESQLSQVSSDSRLSIGSNDDRRNQKSANYTQESSTNVDISEEAQMPKFNENSNSYHPPSGETLHFDINKDEIKFEGTDRNNEILPPVYQSEMLDSSDDKKRSEINRQISVTQAVEEISNGTFNTESRNSTYFDDDSERGNLQIIEDPTQDFSREQSRPPSRVFQKPEIKDERNTQEENFQILIKDQDISKSPEKKNEILESKSPIPMLKANNDKLENCAQNKIESNEKSIVLPKHDDKQKSSKSLNSNRHSTASSHKSHRYKDKKSDREKDKGRKSSSSDSKLSSESYQSKNVSNGRNSNQSSPRSSNSMKENKDVKTNGNSHHKSASNNKYTSSSYKNDRRKSSERDRERKRDHDRSRDDKSLKSEKQKEKPKEQDDHSSERNKHHHRKSTDSNDGDKKEYSKGQTNVKGNIAEKTSEETKNDGINLNNQENFTYTGDGNDSQEEIGGAFTTEDITTNETPQSTLKLNMSNPIMIDNLNIDNIEFVIGSNIFHVQKNLPVEPKIEQTTNDCSTKSSMMKNLESTCTYDMHIVKVNNDILENCSQNKVESNVISEDQQKIENTVESKNSNLLEHSFEKTSFLNTLQIGKPEVILPLTNKATEKNRFETLISPPPKKRKYDMSFNNLQSSVPIYQTHIFIPNVESNNDDPEINLFGFDIQEEQDNYLKVIKDYEESYEIFFRCNNEIEEYHSSESKKYKPGSYKRDQEKVCKNDSIQKSKSPTDNNTSSENCHTSITNEDYELSGKSLTINCYDYDLVPNPPKKKTRVVALPSTEILNSKISPSLSDTSIGSKENEFSEKNNYYKKNKGVDIKKTEKKSNLQTLITTQRYTCDDLYKPRLTLSQRSRRRALDTEIL